MWRYEDDFVQFIQTEPSSTDWYKVSFTVEKSFRYKRCIVDSYLIIWAKCCCIVPFLFSIMATWRKLKQFFLLLLLKQLMYWPLIKICNSSIKTEITLYTSQNTSHYKDHFKHLFTRMMSRMSTTVENGRLSIVPLTVNDTKLNVLSVWKNKPLSSLRRSLE